MLKAKFAKSPLTEVVCGVEFNAPEFSAVHFGLYWREIRERFPSQPLDRPPVGAIELFATMPRLRRVWFESVERKQLIQLQADRFHYNWRRISDADEYPHFEDIYPNFEKEWQHFQTWWIRTEQFPIQPVRYELTYLNQIDQSFGWSDPGDTYKIFSFASKDWHQFLQKPTVQSSNLEFLLPDGAGNLSVSMNQVIRAEDNLSVILFELTARSFDANLEIETWFELTHNFVVKAFLDLIQEEAKQAWGFKWLPQ
jgi:uncharacterized protein (TIGR04255 family)